jgi:hypothetical protein
MLIGTAEAQQYYRDLKVETIDVADSINAVNIRATSLTATVTDVGDSVKLGSTWIKPFATWTGGFIGENGAVTSYHTHRNELSSGDDPVIAYVSEGIYTLTFGTAVLTDLAHTLIWTSCIGGTPNLWTLDAEWTSTTVITLNTGAIADGSASDIIGTGTIKVEVIE